MSIKGKTIVFTGKMSTVRAKMKKEAEAAGAAVVSAVSGEIDFLVYGKQVAHNATNAKYREAKALGIELNEDAYVFGGAIDGSTFATPATRSQSGSPRWA